MGKNNPISKPLKRALSDYDKAKTDTDGSKEFMAANLATALQNPNLKKAEKEVAQGDQTEMAELDNLGNNAVAAIDRAGSGQSAADVVATENIHANPKTAKSDIATRQAQLKAASTFGAIGALNDMNTPTPNVSTAPA